MTDDDLEAADTLRMSPLDLPFDPDATGVYDISALAPPHYVGHSTRATRLSTHRRRLIRDTQQEIIDLREALAAGWDVGFELAHQERRLAVLEAS